MVSPIKLETTISPFGKVPSTSYPVAPTNSLNTNSSISSIWSNNSEYEISVIVTLAPDSLPNNTNQIKYETTKTKEILKIRLNQFVFLFWII